jgi:hypothetical protein
MKDVEIVVFNDKSWVRFTEYQKLDEELKQVVISARDKVRAKMNEYKIADAIEEIINLFRRANKYIDETMPWALAKDESKKDRLKTVLYNEGISGLVRVLVVLRLIVESNNCFVITVSNFNVAFVIKSGSKHTDLSHTNDRAVSTGSGEEGVEKTVESLGCDN